MRRNPPRPTPGGDGLLAPSLKFTRGIVPLRGPTQQESGGAFDNFPGRRDPPPRSRPTSGGVCANPSARVCHGGGPRRRGGKKVWFFFRVAVLRRKTPTSSCWFSFH